MRQILLLCHSVESFEAQIKHMFYFEHAELQIKTRYGKSGQYGWKFKSWKVSESQSHHSFLFQLRIQTDISTDVALNASPKAIAISCAFHFLLAPFMLQQCLLPSLNKLGTWYDWSINGSLYYYFHKQLLCDVNVLLCVYAGCFGVVNRSHTQGVWLWRHWSLNDHAKKIIQKNTKFKSQLFHDPVLSFIVRSGYPMDLGCNIGRSKVDVKVAKFKLFFLLFIIKEKARCFCWKGY